VFEEKLGVLWNDHIAMSNKTPATANVPQAFSLYCDWATASIKLDPLKLCCYLTMQWRGAKMTLSCVPTECHQITMPAEHNSTGITLREQYTDMWRVIIKSPRRYPRHDTTLLCTVWYGLENPHRVYSTVTSMAFALTNRVEDKV